MRFCSKFRFKNETIFAFHTLKSYLGIWNVNVHTPMTSYAFQLWRSIFQTNSVTAFCVLFSIDYLEGLAVELLLESYIFIYQIVQIFHFQLWDSSCHNHFKPRLLINMHDIITKNNRAHLRTMGYLCTTYGINPMCKSGGFVFTSTTWQNHINMHDIITNNNRAHLYTVGYLCTTYDINPMCGSGDFVFTSSTWQNHIKPRPLRILMIFNVFIPWSSVHYLTTLSC